MEHIENINVSHLIFFGACAAVVAATLYFYIKRRNTRRFLTTMRLSVLDRTVQQACRHIENNFSNPKLTVAEVCRELVTGEAYLNTLFTKELGINTHDFILQVRVDGIKFFINENPDGKIETVCAECGFADRASAEEAFMRFCNITIDDFAARAKEKRNKR